jgi:carbon-monoxide dehydrogenase large subunit
MFLIEEIRTKAKASQGYIGRAMKRVEDPRLIKGIATYVDDLKLPDILHAEFVRSPHANAKIKSIETDDAKKLPGVVGIFTGADVNPKVGTIPCASPLPGGKTPDHTVLAGARVYFVGHPVAVVVAETRAIARDALDLVNVDDEPLPAVMDPEKALESGSPLTHPELGTNVAFTWSLPGGDVDGAFKEADEVLKLRILHPRLTPMAIGPRGCVASWHAGESSLTLWTSTQIPHLVRTLLPALIRIPENKLRVVKKY